MNTFQYGIRGAGKAGKTTVAEFIQAELGNCILCSPADYLKELASVIFDWELEELDGPDKDKPIDISNSSRESLAWEARTNATKLQTELPPDLYLRISEWSSRFCLTAPVISYRTALQELGITIREFHEDFLIDKTYARAEQQGSGTYICHSIRFPNELARCEKVILVIRRTGEQILNPTHQTETALADNRADWVINNSGDLDHLRAEVRRMLNGLA